MPVADLRVAATRDSLLRSYSIDDLLEYKDFFEKDRMRLEGERTLLRDRGIRDMESFLENHPESKILDKVIVRLAELYYEKALEQYTSSTEEYTTLLEQFDAGTLATPPEEPHKDFTRTLELYQRIIDEYPGSSLQDDAHYNIAFLTEDLGKREEAVRLYERFLEEYAESRYVPDALFRIGEYYFNPPVSDLARAISIYKRVLEFGDSPKYVEALYRLGWSYYKLNQYPEAISYFTLLADDLTRARQLDPENKITNPSLANESIEYLGISFLDYKGARGAAEYLLALGGRDYGLEVLRQIGDIYMNIKEEYENAIEAFRLLLRIYPEAPQAPLVRAKIAEAYRYLENEELAYLNRDSLFQDYREGSVWWEKNNDDEVRAQGRSLAERALRENINLLLRRADEFSDRNLYAQAVHDSRKYLSAFPKDSSAALIHWNLALTLDAKLHYAEEAFEEYLKISDLHWNSRFQKMAAENAIALAQEMVSADTTRRPAVMPLRLGQIRDVVQADVQKARQVLHLEQLPLSSGEQKLALALDNHVKLFPHDMATSERLAQAGALYYNKNDFVPALKYFKTLLRHFPESQEAAYAQYLTMESYFGKLDYRSCEIVAKRIKLTGLSPEFRVKAEQRLAESIFLQAEGLANAAEHVRAAEEYRRVFEEVPGAEFADLALYNAGLEFDQAREYRRAVETYALMTDHFPKSPHYLSALNNMAYDYGELEDFHNAAITFERLANEEPDSARAEVNLFNASVFFVRAEDWQRAIRVNRRFVEKYPASKDADDLFYDLANYHLKLDDLDNANNVYGEYAQKFPNSPRTVETFYRRGEYYERKGELAQARAEYEKALAKSEDFRRNQLDDNAFFAAEALFRMTELKYRSFADVRFVLPKAQMEENKQRKKNALLEIVDNYTRVAGYGTLRLYEATYKIGAAYEEFAQTWADQEIPEVDDARRIVAKKEINQTAAQLYERAWQSYRHAALALERLARSHTTAPEDSAGNDRGAKLAPQDTTLQIAWQWIKKSKDKVSEVLFDIAELNSFSMKQLLDAPTPENMDRITALEFRNQLLGKYVKPLVGQILAAHQRNIDEADSLGFENAWVDQSRNRIVEANNILAREYLGLAQRALSQYAADLPAYRRLLASQDVQTVSLQDEMANLVDFARSFAKATAETYMETLDRAKAARLRSTVVETTKEQLLAFAFRHSRTADSLAAVADQERRLCEEKVRQGGSQDYQDAAFALEDNAINLLDSKREILAAGFAAMQAHQIENLWSEQIALALLRSDPEKYAGEFGLTVADVNFATDTTWQATTEYREGWTSGAISADHWHPAVSRGTGVRFAGYRALRVWATALPAAATAADSAQSSNAVMPSDSGRAALPEAAVVPRVVYFHNQFEVKGLPVSGQIQIVADDSYNLFLNGEYLAQVAARDTAGAAQVHDLLAFLRPGMNVLALEVRDHDNSGGGVEAVVFLRTLPGWEQRQAEMQAQKEKREETLIFERGVLPNLY